MVLLSFCFRRSSRLTARSRSHSNSQISLDGEGGERSQQSRRISLIQGEMQVPAQEVSMSREGTAEV